MDSPKPNAQDPIRLVWGMGGLFFGLVLGCAIGVGMTAASRSTRGGAAVTETAIMQIVQGDGAPVEITSEVEATQIVAVDTATAVPSTNTPAPTAPPPTETAEPTGESRAFPVPAGQAAQRGGYIVTVGEAVRPADEIVTAGNQFNQDAEPGNEYVQVAVTVACNRDTSETCSVTPFQFSLVGSSGVIRDAEFLVTGVDGQLESGDMFGGAERAGTLFFEIEQGETGLVLIFDAHSLFETDLYLAVDA